MRGDEFLSQSWVVLFSPIWIAFLAMVAFTFFMFPGLTRPKINMKRTAWLMVAYNFCLIAFTITLLFNIIDHVFAWGIVFIPLYLCWGIHAVSILTSDTIRKWGEIVWLVAAAGFSVLLAVHLDTGVKLWCIVFIPLWLLVLTGFAKLVSFKTKTPEQQPLLP
jgi:hypothetical protein